MNKSKFAAVFAALAGFAIAAPALADNDGLYLGAAVGKAEAKEQACSLDRSNSCDRQDTTWTGTLGYMFTPHWGAEASYHYLGRVLDQNDPAIGTTFVRVRAGSLMLVAAYPIEKVSIYAKVGGYRAKSDLTSSYQTEGSSKNNQWTYAVGLRYDIFSHLALRAEWQRFNNVGGGATGFRADVDTLTGGVLLTF